MKYRLRALSIVFCLVLFPAAVLAQEITGHINGRVVDQQDAAVAGVHITLASPALMAERTTVTNETGSYAFEALPPGLYTVKYEAPGFKTVVRSDVEVKVGFTATIHVKLEVASMAETVVVSGEAPLVDVSSSQVGINYTPRLLKELPTARDIWVTLAMTPGITMVGGRHDVGGSSAGTQSTYRNYGATGQNWPNLDGVITAEGSAAAGFYYDFGAIGEMQIVAASNTAEVPVPGTFINTVVRSGSNDLHGEVYADYETERFNSDNLDSRLRTFGISRATKIKLYNDWNANVGGRVIRDKLWWFASWRDQRNYAGALGYVAPTGETDTFPTRLKNQTVKFTYQLSPRNTIYVFGQGGGKFQPFRNFKSALGPDRFTAADAVYRQNSWSWAEKAQWVSILRPKLLLDAMVGNFGYNWPGGPYDNRPRYEDLSNSSFQIGPPAGGLFRNLNRRFQGQGTLSWRVDGLPGGTHNLKIGAGRLYEDRRYRETGSWIGNARDTVYLFRGCTGVAPNLSCDTATPAEIRQYKYPWLYHQGVHTHFLFLQDGWEVGRHLRLNLGVRMDQYRTFWRDQKEAAGRFQQEYVVPHNDDVADWLHVAPRLSLAWDIRGNARTVLRASYGRYYFNPSTDIVAAVNPVGLRTYTRYTWNDKDNDREWQPDELTFIEVVNPPNRTLDPNIKLPHTDEFTAGLEWELVRDLSFRFNYVRKFEKDRWTTFPLHAPFSAYNRPVTVVDPGRAGVPAHNLTLFDLDDPSRLANPRFRVATNPAYENNFTAFEFEVFKRLSHRWLLNTGYSLERFNGWTEDNAGSSGNNDIYPTNPNLLFNSARHTWEWLYKLQGIYEMPWGMEFSTIFKSQRGDPYRRTFSPSLPNAKTVLNVIYEGYDAGLRYSNVYLWDLRFTKRFVFRERHRLEAMFDLYNTLNANTTLAVVTTTGSRFGQPLRILPPRVFRLGGRYSF